MTSHVELEHVACSFVGTQLSSHIDYSSMAQLFKEFRRLPTHVHLPFSSILICGISKMQFHPPGQKRRWCTQSALFFGSTAISAVKRESNRLAKLKQIRRNLAVHAELSIRYWSIRTDFESYTCIVLQACTTYDNAWVREQLLINSWQPALNHPFILKFLKLKSEGWLMQLRKNRLGPVKLSPGL